MGKFLSNFFVLHSFKMCFEINLSRGGGGVFVNTCLTEWAESKKSPHISCYYCFLFFHEDYQAEILINNFIHHHFLNNLQILWIGCTVVCEIFFSLCRKSPYFCPLEISVYTQKSQIRTNTHTYTHGLDFPLAVVTLIRYTDCIDPYIGGEQGNTARK